MPSKNNWQSPRRIEHGYEHSLYEMLKHIMGSNPAQWLSNLLTPPAWLDKWANATAERMVTGVLVDGARTWRTAAMKSTRGRELYAALQNEMRGSVGHRFRQLIDQNALLIKSLPAKAAAEAVRLIARNQQQGERASSLVVAHTSRVQSRLIARTETSKASTSLTQARSESLGISWYVWETSEDERVRKSHHKMQGVLINFTDPPSPEALSGEKSYGHYQAGNIFNCRCYPAPLIDFSDVSWSHRVYYRGGIRSLTLAAFKTLNQHAARVAA